MKNYLKNIGIKSNYAFKTKIKENKKNEVLKKFIFLLKLNQNKIIRQNKRDLIKAKKKNIKYNLIQRLEINKIKIHQMIESIKKIIKLKDPTNKVIEKWKRPNGLIIKKVTVPIGIIAVIYESRPNVTSDIASLCFKAGSCVILRGGSEAYFTNKIISDLFRKALKINKVNLNFVQFIEKTDRDLVNDLLSKMENYIDIIIPRGGKNLVEKVKKSSSVPFIGHLAGVCHTYIDKDADLKKSIKIVFNAKLRNTAICGATETLLIHEKILNKFVNPVIKPLYSAKCKIYVDKKIKKKFKGKLLTAKKNSWHKEYLDKSISVKAVKSIDDAIDHINRYGTMHTDAIITQNKKSANYFLKNVNSSIGILNSSTQFADGGEFGFGGEVGISTNKLPPRGPVGLNQLVTYKYEIIGNGQIRK
ncbi:MAG: glutamate-5-semialdehyde dehydrogenase [Pelagibacteraceae bacterium TMED246]|nr:MAG: glutamate-5-semialdehyde dehydrogenase [Pelagibacteraceae bacterium TMED246]|tara:strand:- start:7527 stop:8777 length:1251 start_codon:yes stop_codon:yes gene_type:complete